MPFYIRKSVRVGPLRFNLSKAGVGISAGVKGFRVGSGPRGNYVHMGRGGLYYRATVPSSGSRRTPPTQPQPAGAPPASLQDVAMDEIASAEATTIVDSSSAELVEEMNSKRKRIRLWPLAVGLSLAGGFVLYGAATSAWSWAAFLAVSTSLVGAAAFADRLRKTTVILYDLEPDAEQLYRSFHEAFDALAASSATWHVSAEGAVGDRKRNAGASALVKRSRIALGTKPPPYVKTNVPVAAIPAGKSTLYFFPDKVLVFQQDAVGAVSYSRLVVSTEPTRFIETNAVPRDAKVVDRTWQYVNKKGGPDKRFANNRELPIVLYEDVSFQSDTGLNERVKISRVGFGQPVAGALADLAAQENAV